jgi:hypothetical protein
MQIRVLEDSADIFHLLLIIPVYAFFAVISAVIAFENALIKRKNENIFFCLSKEDTFVIG